MNSTISNLVKFFAGALIVFGLSGNAALAVNNCGSDSNTFSSSIGATTSCANNNMFGCTVGAGGTGCAYGNNTCGFTVSVLNGGVGQSGDKSTTYEVSNVKGGCRPRIAITEGNQGASYCSYFYPDGIEDGGDRLFTESKNGKAVAHKQLDVCTDGEVQAPVLSPPVISLEKTVGREETDGTVDCSANEISVIAGDSGNPTEVTYCYTVRNDGLGDFDGLVIRDDFGTPGVETLDVDCLNSLGEAVTSLGLSESCVAKSDPVTIPNTVERVVNEAFVEGTFNSEPTPCATCTDSDTATVNVVVQCDVGTQKEADATGKVVERLGRQGITRCAPRENSVISGVGLLCDDTCAPRPECADSNPLLLPAHCSDPDVLQCKPSGNWAHTNALGDYIQGFPPSPSNRPLCPEVLRNITNSSSEDDVKNPVLTFANGRSVTVRTNPYLYYFPSSGGGNSIGTIYCILYPGEVAATVCPAGSIVY